jgi:hypothetical protein
MQNDAIRRAEEMQKRARKTSGLETQQSKTEPPQEPRHIPMPGGYLSHNDSQSSQSPPPPREENKKNPFLGNIENGFGDINLDSDKALLLSLIMLLSQESADELLIMALIYILAQP